MSLPVPADLVVNTFERTYRNVLAPGFFRNIERANLCKFAQKIALINNVNDQRDGTTRAERLLQSGEIDAYYFVADHLKRALTITGLTHRDLGRVFYFTDWALVAVTLPGSPYLLHWDAAVRLRESSNWVGPAIHLMEKDGRILVANPNWSDPTVRRETLWVQGDFSVGYGFSDQLFLARRSELARPIYKYRCLASLRYPNAHIASTFEKRVDAYMRIHRRLRATYTAAVWEHAEKEGSGYPRASFVERLRNLRNKAIVKLLRRSPFHVPCWKI